MKRLLFVIMYLSVSLSLLAQTGPGGVGNSTTNLLWLKVDAETGYSNGDGVSPFTDQSNNGNDFTEGKASKKPLYTTNAINSLPVADFDGTDDRLKEKNIEQYFDGLSEFTIFSVTKSDVTGADHGFFDVENPEGSDDLTGIRYAAAGVDGGGTNVIRMNLNTTSGFTGYESASYVQTTSAQMLTFDWAAGDNIRMFNSSILDVPTSAGTALIGTTDGARDGLIGSGPLSEWDGWVAEFIIFNEKLNDAQRIVVDNYLSSKYDMSIGVNDHYSEEATHANDVTGIGRVNEANIYGSTFSGIMGVEAASDLGDGEYMFMANDAGGIASWDSGDVPNSAVQRLSRTWIVDETGDVGTVSVLIDTSTLPAQPIGFPKWILLVDDDGDFTSGATIYNLAYDTLSQYIAVDVDIADGNYLAIASAFNMATGIGNFNSPLVWALGISPGSGQEAVIGTGSAVTLSADDQIGSLTIQAGATFSLGSSTLTLDAGTINNSGTFNMNSGSLRLISDDTYTIPNLSYNSLELGGTGTKSLPGNTTISGDLTISGGIVDVTGSNFSLNVTGDWNNTGGTFTAQSGTVTFDGGATQQITSNASSFFNVVVNNSSASGITLGDDLTVTNVATMTDGIINTGVNRVYINNDAFDALTGYSSVSFINGNLRRDFARNNDTYGFPVGNGTSTGDYYLAEIINDRLNGINFIDASFDPLANHNDSEMSLADVWLTYTSVNTTGIWTIEPDAQPNSGAYDMRLYITNYTGLLDNQFALLKRPVGSVSGADWEVGGGVLNSAGDEGRMVADGYMLRYGLTSFSEFGAGEGEKGLPIELLSFEAEVIDKEDTKVKLEWVTATEINNDRFTIERSVDGENFEIIATKQGAGNSSETLYYDTYDHMPLAGTSYYRLKQTDYDGTFAYSDLIAVTIAEQAYHEVKVYPNPLDGGELSVDIKRISKYDTHDLSTIQVHDLTGAEIWNDEVLLHEGRNAIKITPPNGWTPGIYIVRVLTGSQTYQKKLVVQ